MARWSAGVWISVGWHIVLHCIAWVHALVYVHIVFLCISVYLKICVCNICVCICTYTYSIYICTVCILCVWPYGVIFFWTRSSANFLRITTKFPHRIPLAKYWAHTILLLWRNLTLRHMHIIYTFLCVALSCWYIYIYIFMFIYILYIYILHIYYIYTCTLYSPVKILTRVKCQAVKPLRESFRMFPACISCTNDLPGLPLLKLSNLSIFPRRMGVPQDSFIACAASRNLPYHAWAQPWGLCYRWCEVLRVQNLHLRCQNVSFVVHIFLHSHLGCWDSNSSWLADFWTLRLETSNPVKLRRCHWLIGHHWSHKIWHSYTLWIPWMNFEWYIYISWSSPDSMEWNLQGPSIFFPYNRGCLWGPARLAVGQRPCSCYRPREMGWGTTDPC